MLAAQGLGKGKGKKTRRVGIDVEGGKLVWVKLMLEAMIYAWERMGIIAEKKRSREALDETT